MPREQFRNLSDEMLYRFIQETLEFVRTHTLTLSTTRARWLNAVKAAEGEIKMREYWRKFLPPHRSVGLIQGEDASDNQSGRVWTPQKQAAEFERRVSE